jgi:hypothetical protein
MGDALQPGIQAHEIHGRGGGQMLPMRFRYTHVACLTQRERPNALRKGALNTRSDGILGLPVRRRLTLARGQPRCMVGARFQRECPRLILRVGAQHAGVDQSLCPHQGTGSVDHRLS